MRPILERRGLGRGSDAAVARRSCNYHYSLYVFNLFLFKGGLCPRLTLGRRRLERQESAQVQLCERSACV